MIVKINPSTISGTVHAPASKSAMQRACALALISEGKTVISNPGKSNDDLAAIDVIQKLGADIETRNEELIISSKGIHPVSPEINCGESGLGLRMFAPIAALSSQKIILNGSGSLLKRPMDFFDEIFPLLGIKVETHNGKLPIKIKGPLQPADITIDGSLSSQFLTGLLIAFAKACTKPVTIKVNNLTSKPYIDLTLKMMQHFGWNVENISHEEFNFLPTSNFKPRTSNYTVEGDWSGGAFLLVASAIAGKISVEGLDVNSAQADKKIIEVLETAPGEPFRFDATDCPDLFPPLVALAAYCKGISTIKGVSRLAHKESNRGITLQEEFAKMGVHIILDGDVMKIEGGKPIHGATVHSHHDHRIAMACAVAALGAEGETVIADAEAINKSYPDFYDHLQKLNVDLQKS